MIFVAARAAIEAGPFDPPICTVVFDEEYDPLAVDTLEQAREHLTHNRVRSMDIIVSHIDEDEARLTLHYSGDRLQLNGYGSDWHRARAAYDAAQAELAGHFGITTFKLPKLPRDTVAETRRRLVIEELEAALENVDSSIEHDRGKIVPAAEKTRASVAQRTKADQQAAAKPDAATRRHTAQSGADAKQSARASNHAAISAAKSLGKTVKQGVKSLATRVAAGRKRR